jgi:hypothetical protein
MRNIIEARQKNEVNFLVIISAALVFIVVGFMFRLSSRFVYKATCTVDVCGGLCVQVEGIVLQRFGRECCRIYRLLSIKGQLEQKQVRFSGHPSPQASEAEISVS